MVGNCTSLAQRRIWLSELAEALVAAQDVTRRIISAHPYTSDILELVMGIEGALALVDALEPRRAQSVERFDVDAATTPWARSSYAGVTAVRD